LGTHFVLWGPTAAHCGPLWPTNMVHLRKFIPEVQRFFFSYVTERLTPTLPITITNNSLAYNIIMPPCIHPKHKRKKTIYVALILTLKLAGNDGFHFAHHGHLVETAIVTRLLSSDTSDPTEQARLPHVTMPHPHPKSSTFIPVAQRRPLPITITNPNERDADQPKPHQPLPITITNNSLAYKIIIPPCIQRDITAMPPKSSFTVSTVSPDCSKSDQPENPGHSPTDHTSQSEEIEEESRKDTAIFSNNVTPILHKRSTHHDRLRPLIHA
jgi:hypothetical protein